MLIFSALGYQIIRLHRENLEEATFAAGDRITDTIKRSTRYGMLHNRSDETHQIVASIGAQPGIEKISIFNKAGVIKFSTDEREISRAVDQTAEACRACHLRDHQSVSSAAIPHQLSRAERTRIFVAADGSRTLSVIDPIDNDSSCSSSTCHAHSPETKVLGMINVRMSLAPVDQAISASRRQMVVSLFVAIALLSVVFAALVWTMVHKPVHRLIVGTDRVAAGDLDHKINIESHDELGNLARSFNRMTAELQRANAEINDWTKTLADRVDKKTAELQQAHEHVLRVEKLASIGKLAAIVAHEINNPLAGILIYAKLLLKRLSRNSDPTKDTAEEKKHLETIAAESARCGEIVKGLLQFARQSKPNAEPNDINEIIQQSVRLVQHKLELTNISTQIKLDFKLNRVVCDAQQIKQALVALLINACEAVRPHEGVIAIESRGLTSLNATEIRISDNGIGMDEETKEMVFEPFFTTKEQGKGVGLGLAVVYGIVTAHAGEIEVESSPGNGTTFVIRLPNGPSTTQDQSREIDLPVTDPSVGPIKPALPLQPGAVSSGG